MSTTHIIAGGGDSEIVEIPKIAAGLRKKYAAEILGAPWWRKVILELRIRREAARIYRHRLYSR